MGWEKRWDSRMFLGIMMLLAIIPFIYLTLIESYYRLIPFGFIFWIFVYYIFDMFNEKFVSSEVGE